MGKRRVTLKDLEEEDDWTVEAVSIVDNPAVDKALFYATKSKRSSDMSIESVMKSRGLTVTKLAEKSGVEQKHLSAYKNGSRTMGRLAALKLSAVLGESPEALMLHNRGAVLKKAEEKGDKVGVLNATKSIVKIGQDAGVPDSVLDEVVANAVKYAEQTKPLPAGGWGLIDEGDPYGFAEEGRDRHGNRVSPLNESVGADEDFDDEGRDGMGIRRAPMKERY